MPGRGMTDFGTRGWRRHLLGAAAGSLVAAAGAPAAAHEAGHATHALAASAAAGGGLPRLAGRAPDRSGAGAGRWTVVLDPGHGGIDKGAVGPSGLEEKRVVLSIVATVQRFLQRDRRFRVLLTRNDDRYVPLRERYEFARRRRAALFISVHADANPLSSQRGLSVHTLSARASDRLAARLAARENRSDTVAGVDLRGAGKSVTTILQDLVRRETRYGSARIAALIVGAARNRVRLLGKPQRSADFAVLRAPDVPSTLVELGFLTNPQDEALLRSGKYRKRLAAVLARSIARYFAGMPLPDRSGGTAPPWQAAHAGPRRCPAGAPCRPAP